MDLRNLGRSGLRVSVVGLGCNNFGGRIDLEASRKVVHRALDLGVTLFDTADIYGNRGGSEEALGAILGERRKDVVLATKIRQRDGRRGRAEGRLSPLHRFRRRGEPEAAQDRLDRSLPDARARSADADRGDAAGARRSRETGQGALSRQLQLRRVAGGRGGMDGAASRPRAFRLRAGRGTASSYAGSRRRSFRPPRPTGSGCCLFSRWPAGCSPASTGGESRFLQGRAWPMLPSSPSAT